MHSFLLRLVTNLSKHDISAEQLKILQKGLKFIPTNLTHDIDIKNSTFDFFRKMSTQFFFRDDCTPKPKLWKPSQWIPPNPKNTNLLTYFELTASELNKTFQTTRPFSKSNMTKTEQEALQNLKDQKEIVIKPADKGGSIVIMDADVYTKKIEELLCDTTYYEKLTYDPTSDIGKSIDSYIDHLLNKGHISSSLANFLRPPKPPRTPVFYGLPKIHNPGTPLRPIVSANESPTENISAFIDYLCQPVMQALPSYIRDSKDFLQQLFETGPLPENSFLVTADVKSLYTNIPHQEGIDVLLHYLENNPNLLPKECPPLHTVKQLMNFILTDNCFKLKTEHYRQIHGTAMGSKSAPPYSSIFVGFIETMKILPLTLAIIFWRRFIDDIFFIFIGTEEELLALFEKINSLHNKIKFTFNFSQSHIEFLDLRIIKTLCKGKISR